jgi:hypothetical protein
LARGVVMVEEGGVNVSFYSMKKIIIFINLAFVVTNNNWHLVFCLDFFMLFVFYLFIKLVLFLTPFHFNFLTRWAICYFPTGG